MVGEEVGVAVIGAAVMGAAVGKDDGVFVGSLVIVGATVDGAAGIKIVGGLVVLGLGMVIADGASGGLAVSCARTVLPPPAAESTVAATSHICRPLRHVFGLFRNMKALRSLEGDVASEDVCILQRKNRRKKKCAVSRLSRAENKDRYAASQDPNEWNGESIFEK